MQQIILKQLTIFELTNHLKTQLTIFELTNYLKTQLKIFQSINYFKNLNKNLQYCLCTCSDAI